MTRSLECLVDYSPVPVDLIIVAQRTSRYCIPVPSNRRPVFFGSASATDVFKTRLIDLHPIIFPRGEWQWSDPEGCFMRSQYVQWRGWDEQTRTLVQTHPEHEWGRRYGWQKQGSGGI